MDFCLVPYLPGNGKKLSFIHNDSVLLNSMCQCIRDENKCAFRQQFEQDDEIIPCDNFSAFHNMKIISITILQKIFEGC